MIKAPSILVVSIGSRRPACSRPQIGRPTQAFGHDGADDARITPLEWKTVVVGRATGEKACPGRLPSRPSRDGLREVGRKDMERTLYGPARTGRARFASRCFTMQGGCGCRVRPFSGYGAHAAKRRSAAENARGSCAPLLLTRERWRVPRPFPEELPSSRPVARRVCGRQGSTVRQHSGAESSESRSDFRMPPLAFRAFSGKESGRQSNSRAARICERSRATGRRARNPRRDSANRVLLLFCLWTMEGVWSARFYAFWWRALVSIWRSGFSVVIFSCPSGIFSIHSSRRAVGAAQRMALPRIFWTLVLW